MRGNSEEETKRNEIYREKGVREINDTGVILARRRDKATLLTSLPHSESGF